MYKQQKFMQVTVALVIVMLVGSLQFAGAQNETESSNSTVIQNTTTDSTDDNQDNETLEVTVTSTQNSSEIENSTDTDDDMSASNTATITSGTDNNIGVDTTVNTEVDNSFTATNSTANVNSNVNNNVNTNVNTITVHTNDIQQVNLLQSVNERLDEIRILIAAQLRGSTFNNTEVNTTTNATVNNTNMTNVTTNTTNVNVTNTTNMTDTNGTNVSVNTTTNGTMTTNDDAIMVAIDRGVGWVLNDETKSFARFASLEHSFVDANETIEQGDNHHGAALIRFDNQTYRLMLDADQSDDDTKVYAVEGNSSLGTLTLERRFALGNFETWVGTLNTGNMSYNLGFAVLHREFPVEVEPNNALDIDSNSNSSFETFQALAAENPEFEQELNAIASANFNG